MSLSDQKNDSGFWGTVFSNGREHSLGGVEHQRSSAWSAADETLYMNRVKEKAEQMAAGVIAEARTEASAIREAARQEGFDAGMADARTELDNFRAGMTETVSTFLGAIEGQCAHIFDQWCDDLVAVSRLAVEKITAIQLSAEREAILRALLTEAVGVLEKRREIVIRVNPEDESMLSDILNLTQARFPDVTSWRVRADSSIMSGGMVVESESSLAEGRLESRRAAVEEVLSRLELSDFASPAQTDDALSLDGAGNDNES